VALSDNERRLLAEMEAALEQDDPRLVLTMTGKARTRQGSRLLMGGLLLLTGMAVLLVGLVAKSTPGGIVGFLVALVGVVFLLSNLGRSNATPSSPGQKPKKAPWSAKLEERWDRRNFEN